MKILDLSTGFHSELTRVSFFFYVPLEYKETPRNELVAICENGVFVCFARCFTVNTVLVKSIPEQHVFAHFKQLKKDYFTKFCSYYRLAIHSDMKVKCVYYEKVLPTVASLSSVVR